MTVTSDPDNAEKKALFALAARAGCVPFQGQRVLEVGCGDGRLTWQYAPEAATVHGIDPDPEKIAVARAEMPPELAGRASFSTEPIETYVCPEPFDLLIFSWSL